MRQQTVEALQQVLPAKRRLPFFGLIERDDLAFRVDQEGCRITVNAETADDLADAVKGGLRPDEFILFEPDFDLRQYIRLVSVHAQDLEPSRLEVSVGGLQVREFTAARPTPHPPEVDQYIFAAEFRQPALLAFEIGELVIGDFAAHLQFGAFVIRGRMRAHHDLVLLQVGAFGRDVAVAYSKDDDLFARLGGFGRETIHVDLAVAVAVHAERAIHRVDLLVARVVIILHEGLFALNIDVAAREGLGRLQYQPVVFAHLIHLRVFDVLGGVRAALEEALFERDVDRRLPDVRVAALVVAEIELLAGVHHVVQIDVGVNLWRLPFGFDKQRQDRGLVRRRVIQTARRNRGVAFGAFGELNLRQVAEWFEDHVIEIILVWRQLRLELADEFLGDGGDVPRQERDGYGERANQNRKPPRGFQAILPP